MIATFRKLRLLRAYYISSNFCCSEFLVYKHFILLPWSLGSFYHCCMAKPFFVFTNFIFVSLQLLLDFFIKLNLRMINTIAIGITTSGMQPSQDTKPLKLKAEKILLIPFTTHTTAQLFISKNQTTVEPIMCQLATLCGG